MKTLKLTLIIAISALITIGFASCDPEEILLEGDLTIVISSYGPYTGKPLTAVYTGDEEVTYEWFNGSTSMATTGTIGREKVYTPSEVGDGGSYNVKITSVENPEESMFAKNGPIQVTKAPAWIDFFGTWFMKGSENGNWHGAYDIQQVVDETLTITDKSLKVVNTFEGLERSKYAAGNDISAPFEYIEYTIDKWEVQTLQPNSTYSSRYKVTVKKEETKYLGYTPEDSFYLMILKPTEGSTVISLYRGKQDGTTAWGNNDGSSPRVYVRQ